MDNLTTAELEARRSALLKQLGQTRPLIEGSLAVVHRRCGTAACRCHQDDAHRHRQVMVCKKVDGRSYSTHVPKDLEETVREWNEEHKRVKRLLKEISDLSEQIIRRHVGSRRATERQQCFDLVDAPSSRHGRRERGCGDDA